MEGEGSIGGGPECRYGPKSERRIGSGGRARPVRRQDVVGHRPAQVRVAEALVVRRRGQMALAPVAQRQGPVRHLTDEPLEEPIAPDVGCPLIGLLDEELALDEPPEDRLDLLGRRRPDGRQRRRPECLAEHRRVADQSAIRRFEAVEPGCHEGLQRLRHGQAVEPAADLVRPVDRLELAAVDEHPEGLDRIERHALGPVEDAFRDVGREPGSEPGEQLGHRHPRQRIEMEADVVPAAHAPIRAGLEQRRAGQGHDQDRSAGRILGEVLDEVEQAAVGPMEVVEQEHGRAAVRDPLEERPPGRERLLALPVRRAPDTEQRGQVRLDPAPLGVVGDELGQARREPSPGEQRGVPLGDPGPSSDHLGERPEGEALAVRGRSSMVPRHLLDHAVDVLLELPADPALADPGLAEDRHEPDRPFFADRGKEVLDDPEGALAADQRPLGQDASAEAVPARHHLARLPGRNR